MVAGRRVGLNSLLQVFLDRKRYLFFTWLKDFIRLSTIPTSNHICRFISENGMDTEKVPIPEFNFCGYNISVNLMLYDKYIICCKEIKY